MAAKTVSLPPVRVEPEMRDALAEIAEAEGVSMYVLTRQAVASFIYRYRVDAALAAHPVDDEPLGVPS